MIEIERVTFRKIKNEWVQLYNEDKTLSPFNSYEFAAEYRKSFFSSPYRIGMRQAFYRIYDEKGCLAIIPIEYRHRNYYLLGHHGTVGHLNIITRSGITEKEVEESFNLLKNEIKRKGGKIIFLDRVLDDSVLGHFLRNNYDAEFEQIYSKLSIDTYKDYFVSLTRKSRYRVYAGYNRAATDNRKISFQFITNERIPLRIMNRCADIYCKRFGEKNGIIISKLRQEQMRYLNASTNAARTMENNFTVLMYIDDIMVAFAQALLKPKYKQLLLIRLAFDSEYRRYNPGMLSIMKAIEVANETLGIETIDFGRGEEDYKSQILTEKYYGHNYKIML